MNIIHSTIAKTFLAVLILTSTQSQAQDSTTATSLQSIPQSAAAYIHFDIPGLAKFKGLEFPKALFNEIQGEIDELSIDYFGVRQSELVDAAIVVPSAAISSMPQGDPSQQVIGLLSFSKPINPQQLADSLGGTWNRFNAGGRKIFVNESTEMAILHFADNAIAFGSKHRLKWFIKQRAETADQSGQLAKTFSHAHEGQIVVGINGKILRSEMKDRIPYGFESLASLEWSAIAIDLADGVRLKQVSSFATPADAEESAKQLDNMVKFMKLQVKSMESMAKRQFDNRQKGELTSTSMALSQLAISRYAKKVINNVETKQNGNQIETEIHVREFDLPSTMMVCLAAIQSIGTAANSEFEAIAAEISAK